MSAMNINRKNSIATIICILSLAVAGCSSIRNAGQNKTGIRESETSFSGKFHLLSINGEPVKQSASGEWLTFIIDPDAGQISGFAGCNRFFGTYSLQADTLRIGVVAATKMACTDNTPEQKYLSCLSGQKVMWQLEGEKLILKNAEQTLAFIRFQNE